MKFNIDNLFRTKLNEINYDFKPEYWEEMEQMIEKEGAAGISGGGFFSSSLFFKTAVIFTITILIGLLSFLYFGNKKPTNPQPEIKTETTITQDAPIEIIKENTDNVTEINNEIDSPIEKVAPKPIAKTRNTILIDYYKVSPSIIEYISARLDKELDIKIMRNLKPYTIGDDPLIYDDDVILPERTKQATDKPVVTRKPVKKPNEPKNVKPMEKPVKHVFKKKRGLLWHLGFRR